MPGLRCTPRTDRDKSTSRRNRASPVRRSSTGTAFDLVTQGARSRQIGGSMTWSIQKMDNWMDNSALNNQRVTMI